MRVAGQGLDWVLVGVAATALGLIAFAVYFSF